MLALQELLIPDVRLQWSYNFVVIVLGCPKENQNLDQNDGFHRNSFYHEIPLIPRHIIFESVLKAFFTRKEI